MFHMVLLAHIIVCRLLGFPRLARAQKTAGQCNMSDKFNLIAQQKLLAFAWKSSPIQGPVFARKG
jgi:hypothetical protein